ncbi:MAG: VIT and VWA domain-containing protein [Phycisphaerae bacterium]
MPQNAAVDDMVMTVGERRIVGRIQPRDQARAIYEAARAAGHVTGLLDQERPNIFTQSVANIEPGVEVVIELSYVETLKYEEGEFEFVFPMVVGPRYIPGGGSAEAPMTRGRPTPEVPDGHRITPPVTPPGTRAGHDISLTVSIDAGLELGNVNSVLHKVNISHLDKQRSVVTLANEAEIPNKDFILHYRTGQSGIGDAFFTHTDGRGTFFTLLLQPPQRVVPDQVVPREIIFVLDSSGSMSGFPIEKAKQVMAKAIEAMRPGDTFNLITFAGNTRILWDRPRANTAANRAEAQAFLASRRGGGGTEMMKAINAALIQPVWDRFSSRSNDPGAPGESLPHMRAAPLRVVCFMTDGYVGNDMAIIDAVKKNANTTRVFSFGVGNSVNRFLLDGIASAGRGEAEYVSLQSDADAAVARFCNRIAAPVLADISLDFGSLRAHDIHPANIPDLFSAKPILVHGRLEGTGSGTVTLRGRTGKGAFERRIHVTPSERATHHDALASLWARAKVEDLMMQDYAGLQQGRISDDLREQITRLGVDYRLMTQFTSFVAVEEMTVTIGGEPTRIDVPVEMPDGVSYEGVFGSRQPVGGFAQAKRRGGMQRVVRALRGNAGRRAFESVEAALPARPVRSARSGKGAFTSDVDDLRRRGGANEGRQSKLSESLRKLAERVAKKGKNGNLTVGKLRVIDFKVDVLVFLRDTSEATLKALKDLGFVTTAESKAVRMLIGTIDVRKLDALAEIDAVMRVAAAVGE